MKYVEAERPGQHMQRLFDLDSEMPVPPADRGMSQAPLKKGDGDPTSIVCRGQSTGMEDHRHEQESQNRDK